MSEDITCRVIGWNIQRDVYGVGTSQSWDARKPGVLAVLKAADISIALLQECSPAQAAWLAKGLGSDWQVVNGLNANAVLYNSRWKAETVRDVALPGAQSRGILLVQMRRVAGTGAGGYLWACTSHWQSGITTGWEKDRDAAAQAVADRLAKYEWAVLSVDRNALPTEAPHAAMVKAGYVDAIPDATDTYYGYDTSTSNDRHIDAFYHRPDRVTATATVLASTASDHRPTLVELTVHTDGQGEPMTATDTLIKYGIQNADALVQAAATEGVPLYIAAAFVSKESGGQNIFGHDRGGMYPGQAVTQDKYNTMVAAVAKGATSNGVGPMQITYGGYFPLAAKQGLDLWVPLDNYRFGLRIIKGYLDGDYSSARINRAGQIYNSGKPTGAPSYGASVVSLANTWKSRLGSVVPDSGKPTLRKGSTGSAVRSLQAGLKAHFPLYAGSLAVDGDFGAKTGAAVGEFQKRSGLTADQVVGPNTWAALAQYGITPTSN